MSIQKANALTEKKVHLGMSRLDVENAYGFPQRIERVGETTFYFYNPNWTMLSYYTSGDQNPVALMKDNVVGLGKAYYETVVSDPH